MSRLHPVSDSGRIERESKTGPKRTEVGPKFFDTLVERMDKDYLCRESQLK
jgi:hypothetical protein